MNHNIPWPQKGSFQTEVILEFHLSFPAELLKTNICVWNVFVAVLNSLDIICVNGVYLKMGFMIEVSCAWKMLGCSFAK